MSLESYYILFLTLENPAVALYIIYFNMLKLWIIPEEHVYVFHMVFTVDSS
jgi:hypothetical protein